ncbi:hypothetical protein CH063_09577, partial [Colletotrichum higginsianum]
NSDSVSVCFSNPRSVQGGSETPCCVGGLKLDALWLTPSWPPNDTAPARPRGLPGYARSSSTTTTAGLTARWPHDLIPQGYHTEYCVCYWRIMPLMVWPLGIPGDM